MLVPANFPAHGTHTHTLRRIPTTESFHVKYVVPSGPRPETTSDVARMDYGLEGGVALCLARNAWNGNASNTHTRNR